MRIRNASPVLLMSKRVTHPLGPDLRPGVLGEVLDDVVGVGLAKADSDGQQHDDYWDSRQRASAKEYQGEGQG